MVNELKKNRGNCGFQNRIMNSQINQAIDERHNYLLTSFYVPFEK